MIVSVDSRCKGLVLIVDDTPNNLQLLFHCLTNSGYKVLVAQNGEIALKTAQSVCPDLILLDVKMDGLDGFDICRYLKSNSNTENIPVIFMTALTETISKVKGFKAGAVDYITKPIEQEELIARIDTHLNLKRLNEKLRTQAAEEKILFQLSERIRQSLDIESTLQTAVSEIQQLFGYDRVIINRLNTEDVTFSVQSIKEGVVGVPPGYYSYYFSELFNANPARYRHYQTGNIRVIEDITKISLEPQEKASLEQLEIKAQLIIPIVLSPAQNNRASEQNILWGWLIIQQCDAPRKWQTKEISLLKRLASQIAIAVNQGLLYQQLQQSNCKLQKLALCDPLTKVYNRRYLEQQLAQEWKRLQRIPSPLSLIICDIDHFKLYNDTYGHQQGDHCLKQVATAIEQATNRPADFIARYGGEEFIIVLPYTPIEGAKTVAQSIQQNLEQLKLPNLYSPTSPIVTVSLGIATTVPIQKNQPELLIEAADQALYIAKSQGRNQIVTYKKDIAESKTQHNQELQWGKRLRNALEKNLFRLYGQEITPLETKDRRKHLEILLRLEDENQQILSPGVFLDIAHRCCLMPQIDSWVIENLFFQIAEASKSSWQDYVFTINLSGASLNQSSFLDFLRKQLKLYNLPPEILCFEITESVAITDINKTSKFIAELKNLGCTFALDDFGKGMSSLTYLKNLPVDYLKIDGSFITEINTDSVTKAMVQAINKLAQIIGLKTIAEFVENQEILSTIKELNIDYAQGFHLGKPHNLQDFLAVA